MAAKHKAKAKPKGKARRQPSPYEVAMQMATAAYKPAIDTAREAVKAANQHNKTGGTVDQAYDRSGTAISDAVKAAGAQAQTAAGTVKDASGMAVDATAQLGAEQVARAQQAQDLYGQTAKAATEAAQRQGSAAIAQGAAGANATGYLAALGTIAANHGIAQTAANEGRRGEAHTAVGRELTARVGEVQGLRDKRAATALDTATQMVKDERDFQLAEDTLGVTRQNNRWDYKTAMAGIDDNAAARDATAKQNELDRKAALQRAKLGQKPTARDLALLDTNKNGKLDPGEAVGLNANGTPKGGAKTTVVVDRDGHQVKVTPGVRRKQVENRAKISSWFQGALSAVTSGKARNAADVGKAVSIKNPQAASMIYEMAIRKAQNQAAHQPNAPIINRKWIPFLKTMFPPGIPMDLARQIDPPPKGK